MKTTKELRKNVGFNNLVFTITDRNEKDEIVNEISIYANGNVHQTAPKKEGVTRSVLNRIPLDYSYILACYEELEQKLIGVKHILER